MNKEIDKDVLSVLDRWYNGYVKIITLLGSASGIVLLYVGLQIIDFIRQVKSSPDYNESNLMSITLEANRGYIEAGIICLTISIISMIFCLVITYNWYVTGLSNILRDVKSEKQLVKLLDDKFRYRSFMGKMSVWGYMSLGTGHLTGISLLIGIVLYSMGIYKIIMQLII